MPLGACQQCHDSSGMVRQDNALLCTRPATLKVALKMLGVSFIEHPFST